MQRIFIFFFLLSSLSLYGQSAAGFREWRFHSLHTSFPDTNRLNGHFYDNRSYPFDPHYNDSSVYILIPPHFKPGGTVDMVFWFHGWFNNIDSSLRVFELKRQFLEAGKNAILVFPEGAVNAPDSYGGKLEREGEFRALVQDILSKLRKEQVVEDGAIPGHIVLAGHSGAYKVMSAIADHGAVPIQEIVLFDGLYGQVPLFERWVMGGFGRHFIHFYTSSGGGTEEVSLNWMKDLREKGIDFLLKEEPALQDADLNRAAICFIHSKRGHNDIIKNPDWFLRFLKHSAILQ